MDLWGGSCRGRCLTTRDLVGASCRLTASSGTGAALHLGRCLTVSLASLRRLAFFVFLARTRLRGNHKIMQALSPLQLAMKGQDISTGDRFLIQKTVPFRVTHFVARRLEDTPVPFILGNERLAQTLAPAAP